MATTALTVENVARTGLNATYSPAASGDGNVFNNEGGKIIIHMINGGVGASVISIDTPTIFDGDIAIPARTVSVPAGEDRFIGPFPTSYNQFDADNSIQQAVKLTWDVVTSVTIAVLRIP